MILRTATNVVSQAIQVTRGILEKSDVYRFPAILPGFPLFRRDSAATADDHDWAGGLCCDFSGEMPKQLLMWTDSLNA